jgi:phage replication O-like protein O
MASPQVENGTTNIANELMEALCKIRIPGEARQVLDVIFRKTYGWHKTWDTIPLSQFVEMTGIVKPHILRAIKTLLDMNIIVTEKGYITEKGNGVLPKKVTFVTSYCIQKNYELWKALPKKVTVTKKGNKSLPKKVPSKETTKESKDIMSETEISDVSAEPEKPAEPPPPTPPPPVKKEKKKSFTEDDLVLAKLLDQRIHENFPNIKETPSTHLEKWADEFRLMRTADKKTHDEIRELIEFSQQDSFWKMNILSGGTLRKQQDRLTAKIESKKKQEMPAPPLERIYLDLHLLPDKP